MHVLMLNGSPRANGNTALALHEMEKVFTEQGVTCELIHVGQKDIRGCIACRQCVKLGHCVFVLSRLFSVRLYFINIYHYSIRCMIALWFYRL